jgi:hypothetical protein
MTFATATNSTVIIAAPASAKIASFTTRMNVFFQFEKVKVHRFCPTIFSPQKTVSMRPSKL